ncbi:MAG: nitrous oxide reductase family maturation protein NosD [Candidatus Thorarchaeota archaeon]
MSTAERTLQGLLVVVMIMQLFLVIAVHSSTVSYSNTDQQILAQSYTDHDFIAILGNADLLSQAALEDWDGTGTSEDPIIITGYRIVDNRHLFRIVNTDLHFRFEYNLLDGINGDWCGLYLANVTNGVVANNIVQNSAIALHMVQIYNCSLVDNDIHDNYVDGIVLELPCTGNNVTGNHIYDNAECGIILDYGCQDNIVADNEIHDNGDTGIFLWQFSSDQIITNNFIIRNHIVRHPVGMTIQGEQNFILNNTIEESSRTGILCDGQGNTIRENIITRGRRDGISLYSYASENFIVLNSISNNTKAGLKIASTSSSNKIRHNDFLGNNETLQVYDDGTNNEIEMNYYSNWNSPDNDHDNFVDFEYPVSGHANNTDAFPYLEPNVPYLEPWYTYTEALATPSSSTSQEAGDAALLFLLPVTGIVLLIVIGVVFPKMKR